MVTPPPEEVTVTVTVSVVSLLVPEEVTFSLFAPEEMMVSLLAREKVTVSVVSLLVPEQTREVEVRAPNYNPRTSVTRPR